MKMKPYHYVVASTIFLGLLLTLPAVWTDAQAGGHISLAPTELKWNDAPGLGPGVKIAIIEGDLKAAGPLMMRIKLPPKAKIAPHTHPLIEHVTVLSGTFYLGIGEKVDESKARAYPAGGVVVIPQGMPMFAFTKDKETIVQVHGIGPWGVDYLNPADAPAAKKK
jgi:quercetin dioxygenase-like cupin family protein